MRTMTWEEIDKDWAGLQKRHRMEIAQAVARYCIGHKLEEVAKHLNFSLHWTRQQLNYAGIGMAVGESKLLTPLGVSGGKGVDHAVSRLMKNFAPQIDVKLEDDGKGNQSIKVVEGQDAEAFEPYLDHYLNEGHEPAAAIRLAKAEWAGEAAQEAGVIKEGKNKRDEKVNKILFPEEPKEKWLDFKMHEARMRQFIRFLSDSKVSYLRRKATREAVESLDKDWREQIELVQVHSR